MGKCTMCKRKGVHVHVAPGQLDCRSMIDLEVMSSDLRMYVLDSREKRGAELLTNLMSCVRWWWKTPDQYI